MESMKNLRELMSGLMKLAEAQDDSCDGKSCKQEKIELVDGYYPIKIPAFVFESDLEFAIQQGERMCHDIWQHHNWKKDQ